VTAMLFEIIEGMAFLASMGALGWLLCVLSAIS
jgi:hypothetical protein